MDDLTAKVQEILGSEEGMRQIQEMAKALGLSGSTPPPADSRLSGLLSGPPSPQPPADGGLSLSPADLMQLRSLFQQIQTETPATALLRALRPLLKEERRHKVDEAVRILHLINLLPLLQQSGLLKHLLGDR